MDTEAAKEYIETLLDYQFDILFLRNAWGVNHAEFIFVQTARILTSHEELRNWFLNKIEETLFNKVTKNIESKVRPKGFVPEEFIWFFAHLTRWPEFTDFAKRIEGTSFDAWQTNPARKSSQTLREAMSENWEDREFYETFSGTGEWV